MNQCHQSQAGSRAHCTTAGTLDLILLSISTTGAFNQMLSFHSLLGSHSLGFLPPITSMKVRGSNVFCRLQNLFFFFFFPPLFWHFEFPGQRSDSSHIWDPCCSFGRDSLNRGAGLGMEPTSWRCRDTTNPILPQQELPNCRIFFSFTFFAS